MAETPQIHLDFGGVLHRGKAGTLRAAAFVGAVENYLAGGNPASAVVPSSLFRFLPDPLPDGMQAQIASELRNWVTGNALRELDQFMSHLIDQCWDLLEACRIISGHEPRNFVWKRIDADTNVARKHRRVMVAAQAFAGPIAEDQSYLATLSQARNCISHNLGIVDEKRAPDGKMPLKWLRLRVLLGEGDEATEWHSSALPAPAEKETLISVDVVVEERCYTVGEQVILSPKEFMDVCFLYQNMMERTVLAVENFARESGAIALTQDVTP